MKKINIIFTTILLVFLAGCTIEEPLDSITLNEYPINLNLDKHTYDFTKMQDTTKLENIVIDNVTLNAISNSWLYEFEELSVDADTYNEYLYDYSGLTVPAGVPFPEGSANDTQIINLNNDNFEWIKVENGDLLVTPKEGRLKFSAINLAISNSNGDEILSKTNIRVENGTGGLEIFPINLADKTVTQELSMTFELVWGDTTFTSNFVTGENILTLTTATTELDIQSASAKFSNFKDETIKMDSTFTSNFEGVKASEIVIDDGGFIFDVNNNTSFALDFNIDLTQSLRKSDGSGIQINTIVSPNATFNKSEDLTGGSVIFKGDNFENQGIPLTSSVVIDNNGLGDDDYILVTKGDKVEISTTISRKNHPTEDLTVKSVLGDLNNYTIDMAESESNLTENSEFDDLDGLLIKDANLKIDLRAFRDDFKIDTLTFHLRIQGKKDEVLSDIKDTTYVLTDFHQELIDLPYLGDIFEIFPDKILFSGTVEITSANTLIKSDDYFLGIMYYGFPLSFEIVDNNGDGVGFLYESTKVQSLDAIVSEEDQEDTKISVDEMYLNAFINNPKINTTCSLVVDVSKTMELDSDDNEILTGDIKRLVALKIEGNPSDKPNGYLISDIDSTMSDKGIQLSKDGMDLIINNDTYISQKLKLYPTDSVISLQLEDSIEVQVGFSGKISVTADFDNE